MADSRGKDIEDISFWLTDIVMGILYFFLMLHRKEDLSIIKMYCFITQNELNWTPTELACMHEEHLAKINLQYK